MEKICVAVRLRPSVSEDSVHGTYWKIDDNRISLHRPHGTPISGNSYAFDHVLDESCTNGRVYELVVRDIIHAAVEGFNGTAFAYGQTSSGKTFTMNGSESDDGVIHRAVKDVFEKIHTTSDREFLIRVSYMEIYNEEINDLFAVENNKLPIHESLERGIFVAGLKEEIVSNADQVLKLIKQGEVNKHFGETNMNARSSRSHTIFRMVIESKGKDIGDNLSADSIRVSVLNLVDLAGSERIAKTGAEGARLKEGKHINKSLMILGNVINKLSEGVRQRGHIPYRDSKLTRILQPALGGNAKTSIICTIAPEEVHIEETKGTLQFASRAKRITNCVQVNEILTDAALLKRQNQEIEELRKKLQGSHAEVLEQEVLKLRNDLLKFELEREKLQMELQEERNSHKERDQRIREQQMKIESLNNLVNLSESVQNSNQSREQDSVKNTLKEDFSGSCNKSHEDGFVTPCFKAPPNAFVAKRSDYSMPPEFSPLPDAFSNVADEDTWLKLNKGYVVDLDSLQTTPARKVQSFPFNEITPGQGLSNENHEQEIQNLERRLEHAIMEKNNLQEKHEEQVLVNKKLMAEMSELQQKQRVIRELPQKMSNSLAMCKDVYMEILSSLKSAKDDENPSTVKLLSSSADIGTCLFTTLEAHLTAAMNWQSYLAVNDSLIQEQNDLLRASINSIMESLVLSETSKECAEDDIWKESLSTELDDVKKICHGLEKELVSNNQRLESSKLQYDNLEREFKLMKDERDALRKMVSESVQKLEMEKEQKENALKELNTEVQRRRDLGEGIKRFSAAFASRHRSFMSFNSEIMSKTEELKTQNHRVVFPVPKSLGG
ncbi:kinesin-like protein KIN-7N [Benincasa hispida]|uniref:kinesin-like protein KIN-7N n=1 Tax=Benincasa hispida TaxID=102211 RepID=UPI0018FF8260|nr:kinesin-like protein KIN-7N [Benincasa hispida]